MNVVSLFITGAPTSESISEPPRISEGSMESEKELQVGWKRVVPAITRPFSLGFGLGAASTLPGDPQSCARFAFGREMHHVAASLGIMPWTSAGRKGGPVLLLGAVWFGEGPQRCFVQVHVG